MANLAERARRLNRRHRWKRGANPGIALVTDRTRIADPLDLLDLLPPGALVLLRDYGAPDRGAFAHSLATACRAQRLTLLVADDLDLAVALGAGLHLPEWRGRSPGARVRLWHRRSGHMLSVAAHSRRALTRAADIGADLALLGPVFATASHPGARALGRIGFRLLARDACLPVWALGGVTARTILGLIESGAAGVASVGGFAERS